MDVASGGLHCFIRIAIDEFAGGGVAGAVFIPAFHLYDWSLDVVV
jgi:hypothetical protein